jgi:hypothetical protein
MTWVPLLRATAAVQETFVELNRLASGYPRCTAEVVAAGLARPQRERSIIGRFAAGQLAKAGWRP